MADWTKGLNPKTLVIQEKWRLDKETAILGTNQGLFVAKINDQGEIVRLSIFGKGKEEA